MTPEEADMLYVQVQRLTLSQLFALWRWIYVEIAGRLQKAGL
jgi:hypothetical protein